VQHLVDAGTALMGGMKNGAGSFTSLRYGAHNPSCGTWSTCRPRRAKRAVARMPPS
jgi:hypothetical protein